MINRPLYVDKIMAYTDTPFVKVLTGVRRCGKSTVFKMIMEKPGKAGESISSSPLFSIRPARKGDSENAGEVLSC